MASDGKTDRHKHTHTHTDKVWSIINFSKVTNDFENKNISNVIAIASLVSEIWLATERHGWTHTHTQTRSGLS